MTTKANEPHVEYRYGRWNKDRGLHLDTYKDRDAATRWAIEGEVVVRLRIEVADGK